jgi:hypothetical protein
MSLPARAAAAWDAFFFRPVDARFVDGFRIGYAALLLVNCLVYLPFVETWWGSEGVLPFEVARRLSDPDTLTIFTWLPKDDVTLWICFSLFTLQVVGLLVGYKSHVQAVCVFIWLTSFQHRLYLINDGEDTVFRLFGFLLIFMPIGGSLAVDAWSRRLETPRVPAWALRLVQFQTALIVFCTGWEKLRGATWLDGTAMYYVSRLNDFFGRFPVPAALLDSLPALQAMTWSTLALELALPLLVWFRAITVPVLVAAVAFHLAIDYMMNVFLFQWLMILGWFSFLATADLLPEAR